jgi:diguanylate cyclase (GGDEF)-like protein
MSGDEVEEVVELGEVEERAWPAVVDLDARMPASQLAAAVVRERVLAAQDRAEALRDRRAAARDVRRAQAYLRLADTDPLTGALLRRPGMAAVTRAVAEARRRSSALAVLFVDVDGLKAVNDTTGHAAGDALLSAVGAALRLGVRAEDVVVRYGGDEFVVALPDLSLEDTVARLEQIRSNLTALAPGAAISAGSAQLQPGDSAESVIARADGAMYASRRRRARLPRRGARG